jgi:hypothetical protein
METTFDNKVSILADLWMTYRDDEDFSEFVDYNDLGLPLAYLIDQNIVDKTDKATLFINETFDLLLASLEIDEDTGFENLDDLLDTASD